MPGRADGLFLLAQLPGCADLGSHVLAVLRGYRKERGVNDMAYHSVLEIGLS